MYIQVVDKCVITGMASPDNVAMIGELDQLIIGEDTSSHQNDLVWIYDFASGAMTRIASTPYGSETTSPYWHTLGDYSYMTYVVQHPYGESDAGMAASAPAMVSTEFSCLGSVTTAWIRCVLSMNGQPYRFLLPAESCVPLTNNMYSNMLSLTQPKTNAESAAPPPTAGYVGYIGPFPRVKKAVAAIVTDKAAAAQRPIPSSIFYGVQYFSLVHIDFDPHMLLITQHVRRCETCETTCETT